MTTEQIGGVLKELLQKGQFEMAQRELFAPDALSVEPASSGQPPVKGIDAIIEKGAQFRDSVQQFHALSVSEPIISYNHIALALKVELTFKGQDKPSIMDEIIVYKVEEGKIVHEQFYY
jgi:hypothetical protein